MSANSMMQRGWFFFFHGDKYRVEEIDTIKGTISSIENSTWKPVEFTIQDLFEAEDDGRLLWAPTLEQLDRMIAVQQPLIQAVNAIDLPKSFLKRAKRVIDVIEQVEQLLERFKAEAVKRGEVFKITESLVAALKLLDEPVSVTTYYKYRNLYTYYSGNLSQIAASFRHSDFNQLSVSRSQLHLVDTLIGEYYAGPNRMRKSLLYQLARSVLKRTGNRWPDPDKCNGAVPRNLVDDLLDDKLPTESILNNPDHSDILVDTECPSERWFYSYIKYFENLPNKGKEIIDARYGKEEWESRYIVYETFIRNASRPLQYVFADHWYTNLMILDKDDEPIRLWFTLLIDGYSRSILGFALLHESPCIESIQQALLHAIWPKVSHKNLGLEGEWPCYGIPQHLSLDNAMAHHSHSLEDLARSIGQHGQFNNIFLDFRPTYKGRYGAIIERLNGNFKDKLKQMLPGAIQSRSYKDVASAKKKARFTYDDIYRYVHELILTYQHTEHSGIDGMTPHEKWHEGLEMGLPIVPKLTKGTMRLFWRMDPKPHKITSKGISAFGMSYWSSNLSGAERIGKYGKAIEYSIRYDPNDLSTIAVFRDGDYIGDVVAKELLLPDGTLLRLSMAQKEIAKRLAREAGQPVRNWLQFTNQWEAISQQREQEKKARARRLREAENRLSKGSPDIFDEDQTELPRSDNELEDHYNRLFSDES